LEDPFLTQILKLDDFMTADPESEILNPEISLRTINFLARTYA
jgi:hypothetical protein